MTLKRGIARQAGPTLEGLISYLESVPRLPTTRKPALTLSIQQYIEAALFFQTWRDGGNALVEAPWESGKTWLILGCASWVIGQNKNVRIKIVCAGAKAAHKRASAIKGLVTTAEFLQVFPHIRPGVDVVTKMRTNWGKESFTVQRDVGLDYDPTVSGFGIESTDIGSRCDLLIFDDPCDRWDIQSGKKRETRKLAARTTYLRAIDEGGCAFAIATPWHSEDLVSVFRGDKEDDSENQEWPCVRMPVTEDWTRQQVLAKRVDLEAIGRALNDAGIIGYDGADTIKLTPWYHGPEGLRKNQYMRVGPREFNRGLRLIAIDAMELVFKQEWYRSWCGNESKAEFNAVRKQPGVLLIAIDPAHGIKESAFEIANRGSNLAESCAVFMLKTADGAIKILDVIYSLKEPRPFFHAVITRALYYADKQRFPGWRMMGISVEKVFAQGKIIDVLRDIMKELSLTIRILEYKPIISKLLRIGSLIDDVQHGNIQFMRTPEPQQKLWEQFKAFPHGVRVDGPDATEQGVQQLRAVTVRPGLPALRYGTGEVNRDI